MVLFAASTPNSCLCGRSIVLDVDASGDVCPVKSCDTVFGFGDETDREARTATNTQTSIDRKSTYACKSVLLGRALHDETNADPAAVQLVATAVRTVGLQIRKEGSLLPPLKLGRFSVKELYTHNPRYCCECRTLPVLITPLKNLTDVYPESICETRQNVGLKKLTNAAALGSWRTALQPCQSQSGID